MLRGCSLPVMKINTLFKYFMLTKSTWDAFQTKSHLGAKSSFIRHRNRSQTSVIFTMALINHIECIGGRGTQVLSRGWLRIRSQRCRLHLATEDLIPPTLSSPITCSAKNVQTPLLLIHNMISSTTALHNATDVNYDALVVKSFHVFEVVATGAYYPKLEFENHKNQYFSWLLRSEHVKTNIFGNGMTKLTI